MQLQIIWKKTRDYLLFDVINKDLVLWFVENNKRLDSEYSIADQVIDILMKSSSTEKVINEEIAYIDKVNSALQKLKIPLIEKPRDWFDQKQLNKLHKDWTETRFRWPKLSEIFYKIDLELYRAYQEMNCHIHLIERSFDYSFRAIEYWSLDNPFNEKWFEWQESHLYMTYPGHGRHAFEQFEWLDDDEDMFRGMNNWNNIDSFLNIRLRRPYKIQPPAEFLSWCEEKNIVPNQYHIPLANLTDWRNTLTSARHTVTKNIGIQDNHFFLDIV